MNLSISIMAHPKREHLVDVLTDRLPPETSIIWDERNDRWHTGKRAMLAYGPDADWHMVVQDDAILCRHFVEGVELALGNCPDVPVSFYSGKTQPNAAEVKRAVEQAIAKDRPFFSMQGPLWGVAIAIPTVLIDEMVREADHYVTPNYDMRLTEYFRERGIDCWYTIPSLVNHRVGKSNPSLVHNRSSSDKRTAHAWIGRKDPRKVKWGNGCLPWLGPRQRTWAMMHDGYHCGTCGEVFERLSDVINHNFVEHGLGQVDFVATSPESEMIMKTIWDQLDQGARGELFIIGNGGISPLKAKRVLSKRPRFTVTDCYQAIRYTHGRRAWSMDNKAEIQA